MKTNTHLPAGQAGDKTKIEQLFKIAVEKKASDLHLVVGQSPIVRIDGNLQKIEGEAELTTDSMQKIIFGMLSEQRKEQLIKERDLDMSYEIPDVARFRVNMHWEKGNLGLVARVVTHHIPNMDEISMPEAAYNLARLKDGLILVTGPTGCGKSTTLAAMISLINTERNCHIVTLEDPVEFIFDPQDSIIKQRELGSDVITFASGLKHTLRQDPDVIMVGEMRDPESISIALTAAETGHLVFSTLHTNSVSQTIDRIVDSFPGAQQGQIRSQLASTLIGIVSQRLVPRIAGGRIPACEIMFVNSAIKNLIREKKTYQIDLVIDTSVQEGMTSLNRSLVELVRKREISLESAETYSLNPSELRQLLG